MEFGVGRQGVGKHVESFLQEALEKPKDQLIIYWVTFTVDFARGERLLEDAIFELFGQLKKDGALKNRPTVRVICRHPESNKFGSVVSSATLEKLHSLGVEVKGLRDQKNALADQSDIENDYGKLHAKFVVSALDHQPDQLDAEDFQPDALLFGSFNLSVNSLRASCESFAKTRDHRVVKDAFVQAKQMWNSATPLTAQDCQEFVGLPIVPVHGTREIPSSSQTWDYPEPFGPVLELLDHKLQNHPQQGQDIQSRIFQDLWQRERALEIVYLPVGCGKTYIALRWILQHLADAWDPKNPPQAWYLTPNQWIEFSVNKALTGLLNEARQHQGLTQAQCDMVQRHLLVGRASAHSKRPNKPVAAVVDEVHNWAPFNGNDYGLTTYTGVVNELRKKNVPILGMSATPCRVEEGKFDRSVFVEKWLGEHHYEVEDTRPLLTFPQAVDEGFVCDLAWKKIAEDKQPAISEVLRTGVAKLGDYAGVVLGQAWDILTSAPRDAKKLAQEIVEQIADHRSKRIVVFLPPVADRLDGFVNVFQKSFLNKFPQAGKNFFDFRSSGGEASEKVFRDFAKEGASADSPHVLLTIDRFSEGVSVNDIDLLVMLRPTLSPRVAVQQVGRGVRMIDGKKKCIVLDAVNFQHRWDEWNGARLSNSTEEDEEWETPAIDITELGDMTVAAARDDARAEDIAAITGQSVKSVQKRLNQGGGARVKNVFDGWPEEDEEGLDLDLECIDVEELGDMTVAAARDDGRAEDIASITGQSVKSVQKRLNQGGGARVKNVFDDWPEEEYEDEEDLDLDFDSEIDVSELGDMTVAAARNDDRAEDIASITGQSVKSVQKRLAQGGRTQVKNAFDTWPEDEEDEA